jgi:predicted HTH transcriptional regulator
MKQNQQDLAGDLIRYNNENGYLEFKLVEYRGEIRGNLIKDVIALANSYHMGDRYIIIAIKKHPHELEFNDIEKPEDSAGIQQYIHKNISPELKVTYEPFVYEGHKIALLTICDPVDQPYFAVRDINNRKTR